MKRLLSAILTLALVLSLIPAVFAGDVQTYTFVGSSSHIPFFKSENAEGYELYRETEYYINSAYKDYATDRNWKIFDIADGYFSKATANTTNFAQLKKSTADAISANGGADFALALKATQTGFYMPKISLYCSSATANLNTKWFISKQRESQSYSDYVGEEQTNNRVLTVNKLGAASQVVEKEAEKVIYTQVEQELISAFDTASTSNYRIYGITFAPVQDPELEITADKTVLNTTTNKTATITATVNGTNLANPMPVAGGFVKYYSDNPAVATVDETTGVITAVAAGEAIITAKSPDGEVTSAPVTVTVKKEDEALTGAFIQETAKEDITGSYVVPSVAGIEIDGNVITPVSNGDGSYNLTAPEKKGENKFLYWAKGMETKKRIISFSNVLENYVPDDTGITYLIAVYEGDIADTTNEYYNRNGQLIAKQPEAPTEMPSIPGLGTAEGWDPCDSNIYVARYADTTPEATITITAGDNCSLNKTTEYAYGEEVICTATGTGTFKCWKKDNEIVSIDEPYSFYAWEDCTVEAVYEDHYYTGSKMKILIDSFDVATGATGVMAEFIGFDGDDVNVVEKGIMFTDNEENTTKIAMTTTDNQFTVIADAGKYVGYAILRNGTAYNLITDGSYEHN